jgi:hypothetical protein
VSTIASIDAEHAFLGLSKMNAKPEESIRAGALPETLRRRLVQARETYGLKRVLAATQIVEATHWRAEAGGALYRGTALAICQGLDQLEHEAP